MAPGPSLGLVKNVESFYNVGGKRKARQEQGAANTLSPDTEAINFHADGRKAALLHQILYPNGLYGSKL